MGLVSDCSHRSHEGFGVPGSPSPAGYFTVSLYKLPGLDSYPGGGPSLSLPSSSPAAIIGRNPSVTRNAFALKLELVLVDHRLLGGCAAELPGIGAGGRLPPDSPERMELVSASLLHVPRVMPPHEEEVLGARERWECDGPEWVLRTGEEGMEELDSTSRSRMEGAWREEVMCMLPMWRRVGRGLFGCREIFSLSGVWRLCCWR